MTETNTAILDHLEDVEAQAAAKRAAEREKALETYWGILADPERTSTADKAAFAAAMKTIGKTIEQADVDARVLESMRREAEVFANSTKAADALFAAERDLDAWRLKVPGELQKVHQVTRDKIVAVQQLTREATAAGASVEDKLAFLSRHNAIVSEAQRVLNLPIRNSEFWRPADHAKSA